MKPWVVIILFMAFIASGQFSYGQLWKTYEDSATLFQNQNEVEQAIEYFKKARAQMPADSVPSDTYIRINKIIATALYSLREYKEAIPAFYDLRNSVAALYTEMNKDYAWACMMLGISFAGIGQFDSAQALQLSGKAIREKLFGNQHLTYAQSCNNLGALYRDMGQWDKAEPLLLEANAIRAKIKPEEDQSPYAITCVSLANLYRDMGQYEKAESLYLQAKEIRGRKGKENTDYAESCNILADLYNNYLQLYQKAEALYLEAKGIRERKISNRSPAYAQSCNNLGALYRNWGQYEKAESLLLEAKEIYEEDSSGGLYFNYNNLGELYYAMSRYKESESFFLKVRKEWKETLENDHPYIIANTEEMARLYWSMNEPAKATALFSGAAESKYRRMNRVFQFTSEREKQSYLENINGSADEYYSFFYQKIPRQKASLPYEMSLLNRNLILSSIQQSRQIVNNQGDSTVSNLYTRWIGLKEQLANLYSTGAGVNTGAVPLLEAKADSMEKLLSRSSSAFKSVQQKITWKDIIKSLSGNECAIEFIEFRFSDGKRWTDSIFYAALVLKKNMVEPLFVPLFEKTQLDSLLEQKAGGEGTYIDQLYSSSALFNLVWRPIEKHIPGIATIYFAPAGNLFKISFGAIPFQAGQVLGDKYRLVQLNTTAVLVGQKQQYITRNDKLQLYGGIQYDADTTALKKLVAAHQPHKTGLGALPDDLTRGRSFRYLPGTAEEVKAIKKLADNEGVNALVLSGIQATEESFIALNGNASPSILHIATHGFFFPDPLKDKRDSIQKKFETSGKIFRESANPLLRAGLLFAGANNTWKVRATEGMEDGIVTAYEVGNRYLPNTKLVVLSACETALGEIQGSEGVYGLQRSFKIAGVQYLVMSLWKVPDAETAAFMQALYSNLFNKKSVSDSFYGAQNLMKIKYRQEPHKWAAWVLIK